MACVECGGKKEDKKNHRRDELAKVQFRSIGAAKHKICVCVCVCVCERECVR